MTRREGESVGEWLDRLDARDRRDETQKRRKLAIDEGARWEPITDLPASGGMLWDDYVRERFTDYGIEADESVIGAISAAAAIECLDVMDRLVAEAVTMAKALHTIDWRMDARA